MEVSVKCEARHICIRLSGELDHHSAKGLLRRLDQEIEKALPTQLTLDLSGVTFMDSSGIGVVLGRYRKLSEAGGSVAIAACTKSVRTILNLAGVFSLMPYAETKEEAVALLTGKEVS